jgi:hypothetical protein
MCWTSEPRREAARESGERDDIRRLFDRYRRESRASMPVVEDLEPDEREPAPEDRPPVPVAVD